MTVPQLERRIDLARTFLDRGLHQQAVETLREVLSLDPDHPVAHALMALALVGLRRLPAADYEAARALMCDPDCFDAHFASAQVRLAQGLADGAQLHLTWCFEHHERHPASLAALGRLRLMQERVQEARRVFNEALAEDPTEVTALVQLGSLELKEGNTASAADRANAALKRSPDDPGALALMGSVHLQKGVFAEARQHAVAALRSDPGHKPALHLLAGIKTRHDPWLGVWWRFHGWLGPFGRPRSIFVLLAVHLAFCFVWLVAFHLGQRTLGAVAEVMWLLAIAYSWLGAMMFKRAFDAELGQVKLRDER